MGFARDSPIAAVVWHVVHLKSLTLKGFKSFASPTTLRFEPGITCVVGPNGSGKSNVVDALTWVMGEQGAKTLRGGKMEDVIFAGTSSRAPLGRAEVTLTIDNSDNALPIEYSEVSITRRMFRDGASEYEINGSSCRLMDVQELLSDSGIGREMHVIVGQGKLSEILESRPEDRRAFIEEAAGVLKHRKRKEKAVRKLDSMSANLARLTDLTTELRRQLKPLGRQAEMARRAQTIQADLRDARLRLAADDLVSQADRVRRHQPGRDDAAPRARRGHHPAGERDLELAAHEAAVSGPHAGGPKRRSRRGSGCPRWPNGSARPCASPASGRSYSTPTSRRRRAPTRTRWRPRPTRSPPASRSCSPNSTESRERLEAARDELTERERVAAEAERAHTWPRPAPRPTAARGWPGCPVRSTPCAPASSRSTKESTRLTVSIEDAASRVEQARAEFETVQSRVGELDAGEVGLDDHHDRTVTALRLADERVAELQAAERGAERQVASLRARIDALSVGLDRKDGAAWLQKNHAGTGLFGSVAKLLRVRPGYEVAVAAVLGAAADALAAEDFGAARVGGRGAQGAPTADARRSCSATGRKTLPRSVTRAVRCPTGRCGPSISSRRRRGCAVRSPRCWPGSRWSTTSALRSTWWRRGRDCARSPPTATSSAPAGSTADPTASRAPWRSRPRSTRREPNSASVERQAGELTAALSGALAEQAARQDSAEQALAALNESDAAISVDLRATRQARAGRQGRRGRVAAAHRAARRARDGPGAHRRGARPSSRTRLHNAQQDADVRRPSRWTVRSRSAAAEAARAAEVEARLAVRTAEERANAVRGRADSLRRAAAAERESRLRAQRAREAREHAATVAAAVAESGRLVAARLAAAVAVAARNRDELAAERSAPRRGADQGARRGQRAQRQDHRAHRRAAPRRGRQGPGGASHRAARAAGARAVRHGRRRPRRRVRARRAAAADRAGDGRVRTGQGARRAGDRARPDAVRPAHAGAPGQEGRT